MAKLIFLDPGFAGKTFELSQEKTPVGRGGQNLLVISDASVSAEHCEILANGPEILIREKGSSNGTFVNDVRVTAQMQALSGQTVRFGKVSARLEIDGDGDASGSEEITAVIGLRRALREGSRPTSPSAPAAGVSSAPLQSSDEPTVALPATPRPAPRESKPPAPEAPTSNLTLWLSLAGGLVLVLIGLWLLSR